MKQIKVWDLAVRVVHWKPGTGLGLSVVRAIADAHGATVALTPREGGGAVA